MKRVAFGVHIARTHIAPTQTRRRIATLFLGKAAYDYRKLNCSDLGYITPALFWRHLCVGCINNSWNKTPRETEQLSARAVLKEKWGH